jgi:hypothetical protein
MIRTVYVARPSLPQSKSVSVQESRPHPAQHTLHRVHPCLELPPLPSFLDLLAFVPSVVEKPQRMIMHPVCVSFTE